MKHLDSVTSFHQKILSAWSSSFYPFLFTVFSRMLRNSTPRFVHPSVDQSDPFLVADTQLYKSLCPSVVRPSVREHESKSEKQAFKKLFVNVSVLEGGLGWALGVYEGWLPLPTRLQRYC